MPSCFRHYIDFRCQHLKKRVKGAPRLQPKRGIRKSKKAKGTVWRTAINQGPLTFRGNLFFQIIFGIYSARQSYTAYLPNVVSSELRAPEDFQKWRYNLLDTSATRDVYYRLKKQGIQPAVRNTRRTRVERVASSFPKNLRGS